MFFQIKIYKAFFFFTKTMPIKSLFFATLGKQMEQDGLEWSCPNCTKKKKGEDTDRESDKIKLLKEKMAQSIKDQQLKIKESQKSKNPGGKERPRGPKSGNPSDLRQMKISDYSRRVSGHGEEETSGR